MKRLVVATKNVGKAKEVVEMLANLPYKVLTLADFPNAPEVEEIGGSFAENAILKAVEYAKFTGELTLADDSGLEVDALNGAPGIYSSRFAPTDSERNAKVLDLMKNVPSHHRTARFRCVIAIADPSGNVRTAEGTVEGMIAYEQRGEYGFGYDPIFYLPELGKHMAELLPEEKNAISHRGKALLEAKKLLDL